MWSLHPSRRFLAAIAVGALAAAIPHPAVARAGPPTLDDAIAAIESYAPAAMTNQGTPGLSIAITDRNATIRIVTLGYADVAAKTPVTPQSRFAIGSITKSMTALALMQLYDARALALDGPVRAYLPWFSIDSGGKPILVHQLLSHTAGIPDDYSLENGYLYDLTALRGANVLFEPGTGLEGEVAELYVAPEARGQGVASKLMEEAVALFTRHRVTFACVWTREANPAAVSAYRRAGFRPTDQLVLTWYPPS